MAGSKCRSWVHAVVVQAKALNPFFCVRRESPHVRSRPGSPPLHSTLALLNSVQQVLSPPKMPGNCLPSLPLPYAINELIAHGGMDFGTPEQPVQEAVIRTDRDPGPGGP